MNKRFENVGSRIDYFIMDELLKKYLSLDSLNLSCGCKLEPHQLQPCSSEASLCAVTAGNQYEPASFNGGGLQTLPKSVLELQFQPPHTGFLYTPPNFSDHIAICVELNYTLDVTCVIDRNDIKTRNAQPFNKQLSIKNFFKRKLDE